MSKLATRTVAVLLPLLLLASACSGDDQATNDGGKDDAPATIDYEAIGLWDDGPCDSSKPELHIGLMTTFESPVVSLGDQARALEAAAKGFNLRGGANGSCIKVTTCDDGATVDKAVACARTIDEAGVVATVNDQGTAGQAEVSKAMRTAGIPRVAGNVTPSDFSDPNAYPLDPSGTGGVFMHPSTLTENGVTKIGLIRVDLPEASALAGLLAQAYEGKATFPYDAPVPAGTTDYGQFILGAQSKGAEGVVLNLGEQEAVQVVNAAQQLNTSLKVGAGLGTFSQHAISGFGDFSKQMFFDNPYPPATFDLPVYAAMRADLAASGDDDLKAENMRTSPIRSWIGLYALLYMMRDAKMTDFTRDGITAMLHAAKDVPMLDMFGGESWTPNKDHAGLFKRAGMSHYSLYTFDPDASAPDGIEGGNFVDAGEANFDEVLCGSPLGAPEPC